MKKKLSIAGIVIGAAAVIAGICMKAKSKPVSISVIGGADGPTSVFLAGKVNTGVVAGLLIFGALCIGAGIFFLVKKK